MPHLVIKNGRDKALFYTNIAMAVAIFAKQLLLLCFSLAQVFPSDTKSRPDLMFRMMWLLGSLFLSSMFFLHAFYSEQFATAVSTWLAFHTKTFEHTRMSARPAIERDLSRCMILYAMMWFFGGIFMAPLYIWKPTFFPFLFSLFGETTGWCRFLLIILPGFLEVYFMSFAMASMAGFDVIMTRSIRHSLCKLRADAHKLEKNNSWALFVDWNSGLSSYTCLHYLTSLVEFAYSYFLLANFATVFVMIPFFIYGLEHYAISAPTTVFFIWCIAFQVVRIAFLWIPLGKLKSESTLTLNAFWTISP